MEGRAGRKGRREAGRGGGREEKGRRERGGGEPGEEGGEIIQTGSCHFPTDQKLPQPQPSTGTLDPPSGHRATASDTIY